MKEAGLSSVVIIKDLN